MKKNLPFDNHVIEYEEWYDRYPFVFQSEVEALREMLPKGENLRGIEVGVGTGRFSNALAIKEGIEPSAKMRDLAITRGIETTEGTAEALPFSDMQFDFVLMSFCISYFDELYGPFKEAFRVLKPDGAFVVGFIDKDSIIGKYYEQHKPESTFYNQANFYSVEKVLYTLSQVGFKSMKLNQTLFHSLDDINTFEPSRPGYGEGSFVVVQARKK